MKFLVILCLLALGAAEEDKNQDKKTQSLDATQNPTSLTQPQTSPFNTQVFPPTTFPNVFGTTDGVSNLAYTGFNGNVSPIQAINPDYFVATAPNVNAGIPTYPVNPVTRTVLPGTSGVVNGIQSAFPVNVQPNVFPAVNTIPAQFPAVGSGILTAVTGVPGVPTGGYDPNVAAANGAVQGVPTTAYRFLPAEGYSNLATQGLQAAQQVGLAAIPAFTSGILPSFANSVLQGQNIPAGIQQILKGPTGTPTNIPNVQGLTTGNIPSGQLTNVFRQA